MATEVKLPRLGQGMESGTIVKWLKSEGEAVAKGEPLYELDTDKVTQEVEAEASGVLLKIAVTEGEVPVGETIGFIGDEGEEAPASAEKPAEAPKREPERAQGRAAAAEAAEEQPAPSAAPSTNGRVKASPLARRIAREKGVELSSIRGTGPDGRIVAEDVERAQAQPTGTGASDNLLLAAVAPWASARSTSSATIRPSGPVPRIDDSSTPFSRAMRRASGDAFTRPFVLGAVDGAGCSWAASAAAARPSSRSGSRFGASAGFSADAGASSPSLPMKPIVSPTGTSPSVTAILRSTPDASASTSCVTLSVSSS